MVINCFGAPGLDEARGAIDVPGVGSGAASFYLASHLGDRIPVVTVNDGVVGMVQDIAASAMTGYRLVSVRSARVHVAELKNIDSARRVMEMCVLAAREDAPDVVILRCTAMAAVAAAIRDRLQEVCRRARLVVPAGAALFIAYAVARMGPLAQTASFCDRGGGPASSITNGQKETANVMRTGH